MVTSHVGWTDSKADDDERRRRRLICITGVKMGQKGGKKEETMIAFWPPPLANSNLA